MYYEHAGHKVRRVGLHACPHPFPKIVIIPTNFLSLKIGAIIVAFNFLTTLNYQNTF